MLGVRNVVKNEMRKTMKKASWFICLLLLCGSLFAQTVEELKQELQKFQECFEALSMPQAHHKEYVLSNGKRISLLEQNDYKRVAFVSADALLERVKAWKESRFMSIDKGRKTLMDGKDLSEWEINGIRDISNEYFNQDDRAFHIAAHGLIDQSDLSSQGIKIGGQTLNAEEAAELIILSMGGYHNMLNIDRKPFTVVLHCCSSGKGENNFASRLSAALAKQIDNVAVVAAPDIVYCTVDEKGKYTECVTSDAAIQRKNVAGEKQNWRVFKNGVSYMMGTTDYKTTVQKYADHEKRM